LVDPNEAQEPIASEIGGKETNGKLFVCSSRKPGHRDSHIAVTGSIILIRMSMCNTMPMDLIRVFSTPLSSLCLRGRVHDHDDQDDHDDHDHDDDDDE
uniref:DNA-directed RNA polymerase n=1 Tax=Echinostoma caproni TaxID=27848 RepID=A0A183AZ94_9TREM